MNAREVAKVTMYGGFSKFLTQNEPIFKSYKPVVDKVALLTASLQKVNTLAKTLSAAEGGFSETKQIAKQKMSETAATLAGIAQVALEDAGLHSIASQLHIATSDYLTTTDSEAGILASATYDILNNNVALLSPIYITAAELATFKTLITTFIDTKGSSTVARQISPEQTKEFKLRLKETDQLIDKIQILSRKFRSDNPTFYNTLLATTALPPIAVNHTGFSLNATDKATKAPVAGATITLSNSNNTDITDETGYGGIDQIRFGQATLTVAAPNYKPLIINIVLQKGKDNHVDVALEKV